MIEEDKKIELKGESVIINKIIIDDLNTYKILNDIKEDKREDFIKKAIIIGAIGLKNIYLVENVDYVEKEFKELLKGLEIQSKDIKNNLDKEFRELLKSSEIQSKDIKNNLEKEFRELLNSSEIQSKDTKNNIEKEFRELLKTSEIQSRDIQNNLGKEFRELLKNSEIQSTDIKNMIEKTLDVNNNSSALGKMRVLFEDYFDKRKGKISDLLSPFEDDSPIKKLKEEIFKKIQELRDELLKEKSKEEIIAKTTLKGGNFEEVVLESVQDFCSEYEDKINFVGENLGKTNKIGDIAVDINGDENKRIVIECKDSMAYSHKKTIDEINDAIENRNAKFGIFLFKSQSQIPSALEPMKITDKYIVTSFENYSLYFALRVARLFVERSTEAKQKTIPIDEIQKAVEGLKMKLLDFKNILIKLTQIDNASDYIRENIDRLKKDIEGGLQSIKELLE
jgi:cytochrome b involved in lipid metabolism